MSTTKKISWPRDHQAYWHEKYAVIAVVHWFIDRGYEARISVRGPASDLGRDTLGGKEVPEITPANIADPRGATTIYYDVPGTIDLVARKKGELWIIQAKGVTKRFSAPGDVAQVIGQVVLDMTATGPTLYYAIVLPDEEHFMEILRKIAPTNPVLTRDDFRFFLVSKEGEVRCLNLAEVLKL